MTDTITPDIESSNDSNTRPDGISPLLRGIMFASIPSAAFWALIFGAAYVLTH